MSLSTHGTHGMDFSEGTVVTCGGSVLVYAHVPVEAGEAGDYEAQLDPERTEQAKALAKAVLEAPPPTLARPPPSMDTILRVHSEPTMRGRSDSNEAYGGAAAYLGAWAEEARRSPTWTVTPTLVQPAAGAGEVVVRIRNRGRVPIQLRIGHADTHLAWSEGRLALADHFVGEKGIPAGGRATFTLELAQPVPPGARPTLNLTANVRHAELDAHNPMGQPIRIRTQPPE